MEVLVTVLVKTLPLRLAEVKAKKVSDTLDHFKAKALVNNFAATLARMKAKTTGGILRDLEVEALVNRTADSNSGILSYVKRYRSEGQGTTRRAGSHARSKTARENGHSCSHTG